MASPGPRLWDLAYLAYRICPLGEDAPGDPALHGQDPLDRLDRLVAAYGIDVTRAEVAEAVAVRLEALADWTDEHARATSRPELHEHAAMYRRDAARIAPGTPDLERCGQDTPRESR